MNVCRLCKEDFDTGMIHHYMLFHPFEYTEDPIQTWPDGGFLYNDVTLEPQDFQEVGHEG